MRKTTARFMKKFGQILPKTWRQALMRRTIGLNRPIPAEVSFQIARTQDELEAAYRILHDSYVEMGYMRPHPSGMRITKYFALPTTTTLLVRWNGQIVGTMSIIRNSPFGLPAQDFTDLSPLLKQWNHVAEVSSLAIKSEYRFTRGHILMPLCKYFYDYARFYMNLDAVVIAVNPSWTDFYEGLLMFKSLSQPVKENYDFANGAPAQALYLPLRQSEMDFHFHFAHLPELQNLFAYFVQNKLAAHWFPQRTFHKSQDPVISPEILDYFFRQKSSTLKNLSESERHNLLNTYQTKDYHNVIYRACDIRHNEIISLRDVRFPSKIQLGHAGLAAVLNISRGGFMAKVESGSENAGENTLIQLPVHANKKSKLIVRQVWSRPESKLAGYAVIRSDQTWLEYINYLENDLITSGHSLKRAG